MAYVQKIVKLIAVKNMEEMGVHVHVLRATMVINQFTKVKNVNNVLLKVAKNIIGMAKIVFVLNVFLDKNQAYSKKVVSFVILNVKCLITLE